MSIACENIHATVGEFQRAYIYKMFIETVPLAVQANFANAIDFQANVDCYNEKAVFPDRLTNEIKLSWCGEFFEIPGVDNSTRNNEFTFYDDEPMWVYDFFSACKDLTGNEYNQAGVWGAQAKFNIGIAKVSVDKETIRAYRRLIGCRVYSIKTDSLDKTSSEVSKLQIGIRWDRNYEDKTKRGETI